MSFNVKFKINESQEVSMTVLEDMMLAELVYNFSQKVGLKEEHKASFNFNSQTIKADSMRKLKDIGIKDNSVIQVKTEKPLDYRPDKDMGSSHIPENNSPNMGMNMNPNMNFGFMNMNPNMNFGYMNMNPNMNYGFMNMNMNQNTNKYGIMQNMNNFGFMNMIQIIFNNSGDKTYLQANINTPFSDLSKRFCSKAGIINKYPTYFIGSRKILANDNQTLSELHLHDNSEISVLLSSEESQEYLNLRFCHMDKTIFVQGTKNTKFCDLSKKFCLKAGIQNKEPTYIINSRKTDSDENKTLEELGIRNNTRIEVFFGYEVIGA